MITNDNNTKYRKTMVCSGGKSKTDYFAWVLLQVYYQHKIPFPVSKLKKIKLVLHEFEIPLPVSQLKDWTMISSEGNWKAGALAKGLLWVYYQIEIPFPVSYVKTGKTCVVPIY